MEMSLRTASLYYNTLRHLKSRQVFGRVAHITRARAQRWMGPLIASWYAQRALRAIAAFDRDRLIPWGPFVREWLSNNPASPNAADGLLQNRFTFLNHTMQFDGSIDWRISGLPTLWRYNLHYFDYLVGLTQAYVRSMEARYVEKFKELVTGWIAGNPLASGDGWQPYPTSLRVVNWIKAYALMNTAGSPSFSDDTIFHTTFLKSLHTQAAFLHGNLEFHLLGNHLIKNAKALLFAGLFFDDEVAGRWRRQGQALLESQIHEQVLADGGHFERSPMYHALVLEDLAESLALMKYSGADGGSSARWREKILRMTSFLKGILHPDEEIPLLNDSAFGIAPHPPALINKVHRSYGYPPEDRGHTECFAQWPQTGYFVIHDRSGLNKMILDCGPVGPDYIPGHAHSDTLSYELSLAGRRVIVDTGVFEYRDGPPRRYSRSTAAHNTIRLNALEQSEVWSSFRVARRARPMQAAMRDWGSYVSFEGSHDGYLRSIGVRHNRRVFFVEPAVWVVADFLGGGGTHLVEGFVHLHPEVEPQVRRRDDAFAEVICRRRTGARFRICFLPPGCIDIRPAPYFPEFGKREEAKVIRYWVHGRLPARLAYLVALEDAGDLRLQWLEGSTLALNLNGKRMVLTC